MKRALTLLLASTLFCTAVYAKTYKISPNTKPSTTSGTYNVHTPSTYTPTQIQNGVNEGGIIEFVMDYSGSMTAIIDDAKNAVQNFYPKIPSGTKIGLRLFGQQGGFNPYTYSPTVVQTIKSNTGNKYKIEIKKDCVGNTTDRCSSTVQALPVGSYSGSTFYEALNKYPSGGATPLVYGLYLAVNRDFANFPRTSTKKIILITDGGENCGGDPCEFARNLAMERSDIIIDVILIGNFSQKFACIADATGGKFYNSYDSFMGDLGSIILNSINTAPRVPNKETSAQTPTASSNGNNYEYIPD
ncbi:MAG: hypothetical protein NC408_09680 [Candidatus Gastranaerophilales bacterium]|nr:hypothetical protein [Candidatus Gastranaerophilales bacterium]MCM1073781.1 hypothetical protein [Bacteroides sp.]